jgi:hypothetical protein
MPEHTWLEFDSSENGVSTSVIIDVTCCQFDHLPCPYVSPDRSWHDANWTLPPEFEVSDIDPPIMLEEKSAYAELQQLMGVAVLR